MIEVVYSEEETAKNTSGRATLPKNIRQIGNPGGRFRIYVEDYVITYLNQLAMPSNTYVRGAILLGTCEVVDNQRVLFISGAVEAQNLEFDLDETVFTNETWTDIYQKVETYFPELEVVGWFLSRLGFSVEINDKIKKTHIENFSGIDKALYMIDALECEDAFYLYEENGLKRQTGYYIYYEKNVEMQNYMIEQNQERNITVDNLSKNTDEFVKQCREKTNSQIRKNSSKNNDNVMYMASAAIIIIMLALGISAINNYDKMKKLENRVSRMIKTENEISFSKKAGGTKKEQTEKTISKAKEQTTAQSLETSENTEDNVTKTTENADGQVTEAAAKNDVTVKTVQETSENPLTTEEVKEAVPAMGQLQNEYYIVKQGDTLDSICREKYHSRKVIQMVKKANNLSDENMIYPGQKLILPSIS